MGPSVREVEQVTRAKVRTLDVVQSGRPGAASVSGNAVRMYKPEVEKMDNKSLTIRPAKAIELNEVQKNEVLARRNSSVEKTDLKPVANTNSSNPSRSLNRVNSNNLNTPSRKADENTFQDNGIKNSSLERSQPDNRSAELNNSSDAKQLNETRSDLNTKIQGRELNVSPKTPSRTRNLNRSNQDNPARNIEMDNQVTPVQERNIRPSQEIPSVKREAPQSRMSTPSRQNVQSSEVPERTMAPARDPEQTREAPVRRMAPERQPAQTREAPARRMSPVREAPARQERVRSLPSRQHAPSKSDDSPKRSRRG